MKSDQRQKPVWTFGTDCPFALNAIEAVVFDLKINNEKNSSQSFLLAGKTGYVLTEEDGGMLISFTDGQSGRIFVNRQQHLLIIEGEWWYRGVYRFSPVGESTKITLSVFNVAKNLRWLAALMILPDRKKHLASLIDFAKRISIKMGSANKAIQGKSPL